MENTKQAIFICIGQAGCQVGENIAKFVSFKKKSSLFISRDGFLPIIFIDIDTKVINQLKEVSCIQGIVKGVNFLTTRKSTNFQSKEFRNEKLIQNLFGQLRDEVIINIKEKVFVLIHGLIGYTGCWLTSVTMQKLKDTYPNIPILSMSVLPFSTGESSFQCYNSMLGINTLIRHATLGFFISNDSLLENSTCKSSVRPSLGDMNTLAALGILQLLSGILVTLSEQRKSSSIPISLNHRSFFKLSNKKRVQEKLREPTHFSRFKDELSTVEKYTSCSPHTAGRDKSIDRIEILSSKSKCKFYFVEIQSTATEKLNNEKSTLMRLIRQCSKNNRTKEKIDSAFLFCHYGTKITDLLLIECLSKKFELVTGRYKVFEDNDNCYQQQHEKTHTICYQDRANVIYFENIASKVGEMFKNKAYLHFFQDSGKMRVKRGLLQEVI